MCLFELVIVAKTTDAHARMQRTLTSSFSEKAYLAVVYGAVPGTPGQIDLRLRRHPDDRRRVVASPEHGLASLTRYALVDAATHGPETVSLVRPASPR